LQHAYPFALSGHLIASLQLCSPLFFVFPFGCETFVSGLSCPMVGFEAFASGTGFLDPLLAIFLPKLAILF
jgi:hypothetical protein